MSWWCHLRDLESPAKISQYKGPQLINLMPIRKLCIESLHIGLTECVSRDMLTSNNLRHGQSVCEVKYPISVFINMYIEYCLCCVQSRALWLNYTTNIIYLLKKTDNILLSSLKFWLRKSPSCTEARSWQQRVIYKCISNLLLFPGVQVAHHYLYLKF